MIRLTRPFFDDAESAAVQRVLASGMLVQGAEVQAFEQRVAAYLELLAPSATPRNIAALAVSNGTTALELALMAVPVHTADEVILPALSWPSPGNAVVLRGATPVLVDIELATFNIDPRAIESARSQNTRAVIAIDQFGVPADVPAVRAHAGDCVIIEDAACAIGSTLRGEAAGLLGDIATYSFHPRKVITTGEGGMVLTRDSERAALVTALRNHGQSTPGVFRDAGPNARLTEMQAAIGSVQMDKLATILARRREMAAEMRSALALHWQGAPDGAVVNHQTLGFVLPSPANGTLVEARNALVAALRADGIEAGALSYALQRLPQFSRFEINRSRRFPVTDHVVDGGLAVPLHPLMTRDEMHAVIDGVRRHASWALGKSVVVADAR